MDALRRLGEVAPPYILAAAGVVFVVLFFVDAPYGRHQRDGWGPTVPARWGWVIMELPSVALFGALWWTHPQRGELVVTVLGLAWLAHYGQRTFLFPFLMRGGGRPHALLTVVMAVLFNVPNASANAVGLRARPVDAAFVAGVGLFVAGMVVNLHADAVLRGLRRPGETGYRIPQGGAYRWVSSANYLGEIVEWVGFALASGSLAAWAFAAFTFANLAPRARSHHRWYRDRFPDYPPERRAIVPFIW